MSIILENQVEDQAIEWFKEIGFQYKHGNDLSPDTNPSERDNLNNCLNNPGQDYKGKIKSELIRVFVLMTENNMTAMEIELIEGTVYRISQILSFCNKVTSEYHKVVSNILLM